MFNEPENEVEADVIHDFQAWRERVGLKPLKKKVGNKKVRSVSLSEQAYDGLKFLAGQHKALYGDFASVSALLESIGLFELGVYNPKDLEEGSVDKSNSAVPKED